LQDFLYFVGLKLVPSFYHSIFLTFLDFLFGSMLKLKRFFIFFWLKASTLYLWLLCFSFVDCYFEVVRLQCFNFEALTFLDFFLLYIEASTFDVFFLLKVCSFISYIMDLMSIFCFCRWLGNLIWSKILIEIEKHWN